MSVREILDSTGIIKNQYLPGSVTANYVPYTGADANLDMGNNDITAETIVVTGGLITGVGIDLDVGGSATIAGTCNIAGNTAITGTLTTTSRIFANGADAFGNSVEATGDVYTNGAVRSNVFGTQDPAGTTNALENLSIQVRNSATSANLINLLTNGLRIPFVVPVSFTGQTGISDIIPLTFAPQGPVASYYSRGLQLLGYNIICTSRPPIGAPPNISYAPNNLSLTNGPSTNDFIFDYPWTSLMGIQLIQLVVTPPTQPNPQWAILTSVFPDDNIPADYRAGGTKAINWESQNFTANLILCFSF
jgi:hypothetical protein